MTQEQYSIILACIQTGAPAIAPQLIAALNGKIELANKFVDEQAKLISESKEEKIEEPKGE